MSSQPALRRKIPTPRLGAFAVGVLALAQIACGSSDPSRFYQLQSTNGATQRELAWHPGSAIVGIGPVRIADHLDRPEIVTLSGHEVVLADFDRWAAPLQSDITRVISTDLSLLLPAERYFVTRWPARQLPLTYKVEVSVELYEGPLQGPVSLSAQWFVFTQDRRLLVSKGSSITEAVRPGGGYDRLVEAMSRALAGLSRQIAADVIAVSSAAAE
jgi:uncharacterized protein